jgi:hypothetical protein
VPIFCPQCQKRFRWTPAVAGRKVRCSCGGVIECPEEAPEDAMKDAGAYGLADDPTPPAGPRTAVSTPIVAPIAAEKARANVTLAYRSAQHESPADPETIKNLYLPLWLLGGGVVIEAIAAMVRGHGHPAAALIGVGIQMAVGTAFMTVGLLFAAKRRGFEVGRLHVTIFKLTAVSLAPTALVSLLSPLLDQIFLGGLIGWILSFVFYFALLGVLFDLDESDTWYCVMVIFIVQVAVYFLMLWGMGRWG